MKINKKLIKELVDNLEEFKLTELEYSEKDTKIKVSRQTKVTQNISPEIIIEKNKKTSTKCEFQKRRQLTQGFENHMWSEKNHITAQ